MRRRLVQLEHARREFVANASHELRTPIFSLGGFVELLANEDLDERTRREFLTTMQEQVERLTKLATDLLDLSRIDAGRLHVEREPIELGRIAETLAEEFAPLAATRARPQRRGRRRAAGSGRRDARAPDRPCARGERPQAHGAGNRRPDRRGARGRRAGPLAVEDAGAGIPAEHRAHVFERFYRIEGNRASGSGLGLAIARELAEVMDGSVELTSPPGRTVFRLRLPVGDRSGRLALAR